MLKIFLQKIKNYLPVLVLITALALVFIADFYPKEFREFALALFHYLNQMINFFEESEILFTLTLVALGVTVPIFVLTVTLVGRAAKVSIEKQSQHNKEAQNKKEEKIKLLQKRINDEPDDVLELQAQVSALKSLAEKQKINLSDTKKRYSSLGFKHAVIYPSLAFVASLLLQSIQFVSDIEVVELICFAVALSLSYFGVSKIFITLSVVQEVSLAEDDARESELRTLVSERMVGGLVEAMEVIESKKKPLPQVLFKDLPLTATKDEDYEINMLLFLSRDGASEADDIEVFIAVEPSIIIHEKEDIDYVKQNDKFSIPNANSVFYECKHLKVRTNHAIQFNIKPTEIGEFSILYRVTCRGYSEEMRSEKIVVVDKD